MTSRNQIYSPANRAISTGRTPPRSNRSPSHASPPVPPKPAQTASKANEPQPTLRVMRLYKPRFNFSPAVPYSSQIDLLNGGIKTADQSMSKLLLGRRESDFALSSCLILPDSFGDIYRGETFCAYISVLNHLSVELKDVKVIARLVTPSSKKTVPLVDCRMERGASVPGTQAADVLSQGKKLDMVIQSVLNETGDYVLKVSVECAPPVYQVPAPSFQNLPTGAQHPGLSSTNQQQGRSTGRTTSMPVHQSSGAYSQAQAQYGQANQAAYPSSMTPLSPPSQPEVPPQPKKFTKYYRFAVAAPVELATSCRLLGGSALVELSVKNVTPHPLMISDLVLVAAEGYISENLSSIGSQSIKHVPKKKSKESSSSMVSSADCLDKHLLLGSQDVQQFLFRISSNHPTTAPIEALGQPLGSIHIQWRTALGESGVLKSPPISSPIAVKRDIVVALSPDQSVQQNNLKHHSPVFEFGKKMEVNLRVFNYTDRALPLHLRWSAPNIGGTGLSSQQRQQQPPGTLPTGAGSTHSLTSNHQSSDSKNNISVWPSSVPGILVEGSSSFNLGTVGSRGGYQDCTVTLLACCPGLHGLFGFVVVDDSSGRQWRQPSLTTLYVQPSDYNPKEVNIRSSSCSTSTTTSTSSLFAPPLSTSPSQSHQPFNDESYETNHGNERRLSAFEEQIIEQQYQAELLKEENGDVVYDEDDDEEEVVDDDINGLRNAQVIRPANDLAEEEEEEEESREGIDEALMELSEHLVVGDEQMSEDVLGEVPPPIAPLYRQTTGGDVHGDGSNDGVHDDVSIPTKNTPIPSNFGGDDGGSLDLGLLVPLSSNDEVLNNSDKKKTNNEILNGENLAQEEEKEEEISSIGQIEPLMNPAPVHNNMLESITFGDDSSAAAAFFDVPPPESFVGDFSALASANSIEEIPSDDDDDGGGFVSDPAADQCDEVKETIHDEEPVGNSISEENE